MSVPQHFRDTLTAVQSVLDSGSERRPEEIRLSIKECVVAYQAVDAVRQAYLSYSDSGVVQMKNFLRAANVRKNETTSDYIDRVRANLDDMHQFSNKVLSPAM